MRKNKIITFILIFTITWIFSQEKFINANKLNIRESPNQNSKIITQVKRNEKVIILEEKNDWTKISFDNKIGFVSSKYLSDLPLNIEKNNSGFAYGFDKTFMKAGIWIFIISFFIFKFSNDKRDGRFKNGIREANINAWSFIKIGIVSFIVTMIISFIGGVYFWIISFF